MHSQELFVVLNMYLSASKTSPKYNQIVNCSKIEITCFLTCFYLYTQKSLMEMRKNISSQRNRVDSLGSIS